jgi:hypothetical protein
MVSEGFVHLKFQLHWLPAHSAMTFQFTVGRFIFMALNGFKRHNFVDLQNGSSLVLNHQYLGKQQLLEPVTGSQALMRQGSTC